MPDLRGHRRNRGWRRRVRHTQILAHSEGAPHDQIECACLRTLGKVLLLGTENQASREKRFHHPGKSFSHLWYTASTLVPLALKAASIQSASHMRILLSVNHLAATVLLVLLVLALLSAITGDVMSDSTQNQPCVPGCKAPVPAELATEGLCVLHFLQVTEEACAKMRHETAAGSILDARRTEIETYAATSATKLACFATGRLRLTDEMKKRVLTTFLTLMILRENLDRSSGRSARGLRNSNSVETLAAHVGR